MKTFYQSIALFLLFAVTVNAQEVTKEATKEQNTKEVVASTQDVSSETAKELVPVVRFGDDLKVRLGGFFRAEYYVDSREIVGACDDLFGFFPEDKVYDKDGEDLNDVVRQNFSTQATRFTATVDGPKLGKANSKAYVEFDFSGGNAVNVRLRQAWAKLSWQKSELLLGKAWSPFSDIPFTYVAGLHTGIPFRPFSRGDQIRYTYKPADHLSVVLAGLYQTEHKSVLEGSSNGDIRQNPTPEFHLQLRYTSPTFSAGILGEFKSVKPATKVTNSEGEVFKTDEKVNSYALGYYAQYVSGLLGIRAGGLYGQNLSEYFQQGGYAVKSIDAKTGKRTYSASKVTSYWLNLSYGKRWAPSFFAGYSKNLGFEDDILAGGDFFGRWQNVDHIFRLSPSLKFSHKQWTIQGEIDYDVVAYGTVDYADHGKVKDTHSVSGVRGLIATTFFF
ncbi:MAG: hypothetical protein J6Y37_17955 [Paludibacteraceae bacterium]|nr:hypothetical protein [Paludibacteraceae bacterium]